MQTATWDSNTRFGFDDTGTVPTLAMPSPVTPNVQPAPNALHALVDPRGSAIFWILAGAILGLVMVQGQLSIAGKLKTRAGK